LYKDLRKKYVKKDYWKNTNMVKFIELNTSKNETVIKNIYQCLLTTIWTK